MEPKKIMDLSMYTGEILLCSGAEIYRVEETIRRICDCYGIDVDCFVLPTGIFISSNDETGEKFTVMKRIKKRDLDLQKIEDINNFSRMLAANKLPYDEAMDMLRKIEHGPNFPFWIRIVACGISTFTCGLFFNGSLYDAAVALVSGVLIYLINIGIAKSGFSAFFQYFFDGAVAGILSIAAHMLIPNTSIDSIIAGSIIILVPGIAITTGLKDALYGDILSSVTKVFEAMLTVSAVGAGVGVALSVGLSLVV